MALRQRIKRRISRQTLRSDSRILAVGGDSLAPAVIPITQAGGSDVTLPLTGVSAVAAVGTLGAQTSSSAALVGVTAAGAAGSLTGASSLAIAGATASGYVGSVSASSASEVTSALTGVGASGAVGATAISISQPATGVGADADAGVVSATTVIPLAGVAASLEAGDVTASSAQVVVVALTGVGATGDAGTFAVSGTISMTGVAANASVGSMPVQGASDPRLDQILAILMGRKVFDSATGLWRVYDELGNELADPSGILMRGLHGWLLRQSAVLSVKPEAAGGGYKRRVVVSYKDRQYSIWDDELKPFLERIKQEELKAKGTKKRARQKAPPEVVIKSAPIDIKEHLQAEVDAANDYLVEAWNRRFGTQFRSSSGGTRIALTDQNGIDFTGGTVFPLNSVVEADMVFVLAMLAEAA